MKIDIHAHILPEKWPDLKNKFGYGGFIYLDHFKSGSAKMMRDDGKFFREIQENCWNPDVICLDLEKYQVDKMVLSTVPVLFNYWAKPKDNHYWCMFLNDHIVSVQNHSSHKFLCLGTLPLQDIQLSISELQRCKNIGLYGVQIGTHINDLNLDSPFFFPLWEAAQELSMAIFVHPWDMMGQEKMPHYFLPWLVGMPAETSLAICSMIFGGIFDKFPKLRVMFAHGGGSFPFTIGRINHGWTARPDLCNVNQISKPSDYLGKFWIDGITHDVDALIYLISLIGSDKISYGTDYPFPLGDLEHGKFIHETNKISNQDKENIFYNSAMRYLGLI